MIIKSANQVLLEALLDKEFLSVGSYKNKDTFFNYFSASLIMKSYNLSDEEIEAGITDGGNDGGIDAIYVFVNDDLVQDVVSVSDSKKTVEVEIVICQMKNKFSFEETPIDKLHYTCNVLLNLDFSGEEREKYSSIFSEKLLDTFDLFRKQYLSLIHKSPKVSIRIIYSTKGDESKIHGKVITKAAEIKHMVSQKHKRAYVDVSLIGADELMLLHDKKIDDVIKLRFNEMPICKNDNQFIGLVKLSDYYNFITDEEGHLLKHIFESNVRDYQGKNATNTGIYETLMEKTDDFWWFNNGVTIVASAIEPGGKTIAITDPEIVNGLQSSSEIYDYFSKHVNELIDENRNILVRVIVPESDDIRDKIILSTNTQTSIPKASLRATDLIHRQIEMYFRTKGFYYDRRKNYYKNLGKKSSEIVSVAFLAQCLMSVLLQKPDYARARPSTLLDNDNEYNKLYQNIDLSVYYFLAYTGRKVEEIAKIRSDVAASERNDILFYVVYTVCVYAVRKLAIEPNDLVNISIEIVTEDIINTAIDTVLCIYREHGGNGKLAKSAAFMSMVKDELEWRNLDLLSVSEAII